MITVTLRTQGRSKDLEIESLQGCLKEKEKLGDSAFYTVDKRGIRKGNSALGHWAED